jgi:hypothetical protein
VYLAAIVGDRSESARKLWKERSLASLWKNRKLVRAISEGMREVEAFTHDGMPAGNRYAFLWPAHIYESVIERTARGLYFHHFGEILGDRVSVEVSFLYRLAPEFVEMSRTWSQVSIGDAVTYRYAQAAESPLDSVWVIEFYGGHWALAETRPAVG